MADQAPIVASYRLAAHRLDQLPPDTGSEVAFVGRSNAGKSSAINALANIKRLAKTSKTPGRTQQIVIFDIDEERRLADLPGYGYAKVPPELKRHWEKTLARYLETRQALRGLVLLSDIRHPLRPEDRQMLDWCHASSLPCTVALTKADKLKRGAAKNVWLGARRDLEAYGPDYQALLFSAVDKQGVDALRAQVRQWLA